MSDSKNEKWMTWVALSTAVMAVLAAITTLYMGKFSSRAILMQGQETNQWSYYQAKSIKSYLYEIQIEFMEMERLEGASKNGKVNSQQFEKTLTRYKEAVKRYDREKSEIKAKGDQLAKQKVIAQDRGGNYGYALIFLQIGLMLSSIAALTKRKVLWYFGMIVTVGWIFFFLDAIFLFY
ncbi:MAG TPA: DUF4337 domain-containing protein [Syntrophorhabdaceae bacterium]|jgi:hypothetical protein